LKKFKTHRCAMDFDKAFCKATFTKSEWNDVQVRQFLSHVSDSFIY
jgi:hypothetical protein